MPITIPTISRPTFFETFGSEFTTNYPALFSARNRGFGQLQCGDRVHHSLAQPRIQILPLAFKIDIGKVNRLADDDRYFPGKPQFAVNWPDVVGAKNPHRNYWRTRFCDHQTETGLSRLEGVVRRAGPFRKDQRAFTSPQNPNQRFQSAAIPALKINGDHVEFWQNPAEHRNID